MWPAIPRQYKKMNIYDVVKHNIFQCRTRMWLATRWHLDNLDLICKIEQWKENKGSPLCLPYHFDRGSCVHSTLFNILATRTLLQTLGWYANIHMITPVEMHIPKFLRWGVLYAHLSWMQVANNVPFNNFGGTIPRINWKVPGDQHINWEPEGNPGINWGAPENHTTNSTAQQIPCINSKSPRGSKYQLRCSRNPYINWKGPGNRNINWKALWNQNMNWENISNATLNKKVWDMQESIEKL